MFWKIICFTDEQPYGFSVGFAYSPNQATTMEKNIAESGDYPNANAFTTVKVMYYPYYG